MAVWRMTTICGQQSMQFLCISMCVCVSGVGGGWWDFCVVHDCVLNSQIIWLLWTVFSAQGRWIIWKQVCCLLALWGCSMDTESEAEAKFIPIKSCSMAHKAKKVHLAGCRITCIVPSHRACTRETSTSQAANFRFFHVPTWMGIKQFTGAALVVFPNVIRPNRSNSESLTCHLAGVVTLMKQYPGYNSHFLHNEGLWEKNSEPVCHMML